MIKKFLTSDSFDEILGLDWSGRGPVGPRGVAAAMGMTSKISKMIFPFLKQVFAKISSFKRQKICIVDETRQLISPKAVGCRLRLDPKKFQRIFLLHTRID